MASTITKSGLETAIANLGYRNPKLPKTRLIQAIRSFYGDTTDPEQITHIDADDLVKSMWEIEDEPDLIKSKRKNLHSIKMIVNNDLKRLFEEGKNPEGISIGPSNTFVMSDDAKEKLLSSFADSAKAQGNLPLEKIADVLGVISDFVSDIENMNEDNPADKVKQILDLIRGIAAKAGAGEPGDSISSEGDGGTERGAMDIETLEKMDEIEDREDFEIQEDEVIEEIEDDEDTEEVEDDLLEEVDDAELEEIDDEAVEEADEIDEDTEPEDVDTDLLSEDDVEIVEDEEIEDELLEEIDEAELEEIDDEAVEETDAIEEDSEPEDVDTDLLSDEDVEIVEDEDIEEVEDDLLEEIDEAELEEIDDEAVEETDAIEEDPEPEDVDTDLLSDDDVEIVEDEDIEEVEDELLEEIDDAELEEIDDEAVEETDAIDEDPEPEDVDTELLSDEDVEVVDDEEFEEIEGADRDLAGEDQLGLPRDNLDQSEFQADKNLLAEQFDGFLGSMERFYNQYLKVSQGTYWIGNKNRTGTDLPEQQISLPDFYMGKYPVTNALFEVFVERTGYRTTAEKQGYGWVYTGRFRKITNSRTGVKSSQWRSSCSREKVAGACWYQPAGPGSTLHGKRNHPVVQVSIQDALNFGAWVGKRLPTEFEWEAAARTRAGFLYPWGNEWKEDACNYEKSAISDTTPVDQYPEGTNTLGIADTLCNVLEWTSDQTIPSSGKIRDTIYHIAKGGSWISDNTILLSNRFRLDSGFTANILGFRCVVD